MGDKLALEMRVDSHHPWFAQLDSAADDTDIYATLTIGGVEAEYHMTAVYRVASFVNGVNVIRTEWEAMPLVPYR